MVHTRQSSKLQKSVKPCPILAKMRASASTPATKRPSYWRDRKALALAEEVCDLKRDIALHPTSGTSAAPSCGEDSRTLAHDERLGTKNGRTQAHGKQSGMHFPIQRSISLAAYSRNCGVVARTGRPGDYGGLLSLSRTPCSDTPSIIGQSRIVTPPIEKPLDPKPGQPLA